MTEAEAKGKEIEEALNELIKKCTDNRGHVYIIDKLNNKFILRIEEPIKINAWGGYNGAQDEEK